METKNIDVLLLRGVYCGFNPISSWTEKHPKMLKGSVVFFEICGFVDTKCKFLKIHCCPKKVIKNSNIERMSLAKRRFFNLEQCS